MTVTTENRFFHHRRLVKQSTASATWMVAAHAWDIAGAVRAGLRTVFTNQ